MIIFNSREWVWLGLSLFAIYVCMRYSSRFNLLDFSKDSNHLIHASIGEFQKDTILNISKLEDNLYFSNFTLQNFQFLQFKPFPNRQNSCQNQVKQKINSFLLINTNSQTIGYKYLNLLKVLVKQKDIKKQKQNEKVNNNCINFRIFGLVQKKHFLMNIDKKLINNYVNQIQYSINQIIKITSNKLTILASQQASILTLQSFLSQYSQSRYSQILNKIDNIMFINLYNLNTKILQEPSYLYLAELKQRILQNNQSLSFFNQLNMIMINTLKQTNIIHNITELARISTKEVKLQNNFFEGQNIQTNKTLQKPNNKYQHIYKIKSLNNRLFVFQNYNYQSNQLISPQNENQEINNPFKSHKIQQKEIIIQPQFLALNNTSFFHTRQMYNIHLQLDQGMYFVAYPFLKIIAEFILQNSNYPMNQKAVQYYFKYGQGYHQFPFQFIQTIDIKKCLQMTLKTIQPVVWNIQRKCFKLNIRTKIKNPIILIYSDQGKFDLYSNSLTKLQQYDKNIDRSLYMIQKMGQNLIVYNPLKLQIKITVSNIFTPSYPLTQIFSEFQILYINQQQKSLIKNIPFKYHIQKYAIKTCSDKILIFPDHFSIGKINRQYLLQESSSSNCYNEKNLFDLLLINIKQNWIIFRNIFFFSLYFVYTINQWNIKSFFTLLIINSLLFYDTEIRNYQTFIIIGLVFIGQKVFNLCQPVINLIHIDRKKIFISMLIIFIIAFMCQSFLYLKFNYWKILLLFVIFFINKQNVIIICTKLYFLKQIIFYGIFDLYHLVLVILFLQCYINKYNSNGNGINFQYSLKKSRFNYLQQRIKYCSLIILTLVLIYNPNSAFVKNITDQFIWIKIIINFLQKIF